MRYPTQVVRGDGYIKVLGDLDCEQAAQAVQEAFEGVLAEKAQTLLIDFSDVQLINSYAVGKLLVECRKLKERGCAMTIRVQEGPVKDTLGLLMVDKLVPLTA